MSVRKYVWSKISSLIVRIIMLPVFLRWESLNIRWESHSFHKLDFNQLPNDFYVTKKKERIIRNVLENMFQVTVDEMKSHKKVLRRY